MHRFQWKLNSNLTRAVVCVPIHHCHNSLPYLSIIIFYLWCMSAALSSTLEEEVCLNYPSVQFQRTKQRCGVRSIVIFNLKYTCSIATFSVKHITSATWSILQLSLCLSLCYTSSASSHYIINMLCYMRSVNLFCLHMCMHTHVTVTCLLTPIDAHVHAHWSTWRQCKGFQKPPDKALRH